MGVDEEEALEEMRIFNIKQRILREKSNPFIHSKYFTRFTPLLNPNKLLSKPTALKISNCLTFIGYESGEFCIFDFFDEEYFARTIAHKLKVTAIDFSALTSYILTASQDSYVKIWRFEQDASEAQFLYYVYNDDGPICGAAFLNFTCTEFCTVTADSVNVKFYLKWDDDSGVPDENESNP